jgi:hypothetical protein
MYKIDFYVPVSDAEIVKSAMFFAGAGRIGNYEHCSFETLGTGQFKPLKGANPAVGELNKLEKVSELKVEMICEEENILAVIKAMKKNHPYEVPAFQVVLLEQF